jgi:hypothetical protein
LIKRNFKINNKNSTKNEYHEIKLTLLLVLSVYIHAQQLKGIIGQDNWTNNWTNLSPQLQSTMRQTTILTGIISSDMVLKRTNTYVMIGVVYVTNKATLTIEAGTVIRGDKQNLWNPSAAH